MARTEDELLAEENFLALNEAFYRGEPHAYFRMRTLSLMVLAGRPEVVHDALRSGVSYEGVTVRRADDDPGPDAQELDRFVTLELAALHHHATETLLRLFIAHRGTPGCPWLALSRLRSFEQFKRQIAEWRSAEEVVQFDDVREVFLGSARRQDFVDMPDDMWVDDARRIIEWLGRAATVFLDDANVYNVVKHGLAIQPGRSGLEVSSAEEGDADVPALRVDGPALQYLNVRDTNSGRR